MNRRIIVMAALVLSLGTLPVIAQGPGQRAGGPGRGGPGGPGGPLAGIFPMVQHLDLTDAQRDQLRAILEEARTAGGTDPGQKMHEAEQRLHAAILADTPDPQAIDAAKTAVTAAHAEELDHRVGVMVKVAQILTPAQRQELAKMQPPGPPHGRGHGRH
jgi:protein CpxP